MTTLRLHVWLALALVLTLLSCRRGGAGRAPPDFAARATEALLGGPAEVAALVDIAALRRDAVYGRMFRDSRVGESRDLRWVIDRVDRIDLWLIDVHGSERQFAGIAVLRSGRLGEADFGPRGIEIDLQRRLVLPTGVVMHVDESRDVSAAIFLVDGHLALAMGAAIAPTQNHFSRTRELPAALDWGGDTLVGVHARGRALHRLGRDYAEHMTAGSVVWRSGHGGEVVVSASFDDDPSRERALKTANEIPDSRREYVERCPAVNRVGVRVEHDRRTVTVRIDHLRDLIAAYLDRSCR